MSMVLKSVSTARKLLTLNRYANLFYCKTKFSSALRKRILPDNFAIRSQYSTVNTQLLKDEVYDLRIEDFKPKLRPGSKFYKVTDIEVILQRIKNLSPLTYFQSCTLLKSCSQISYTEPPEVRMKMVHLVWEALKESGVEFDIFHYNVLLALYIENEYKFCSEKFLNDLQSKGIEPNEITYQRLLKACSQQGNIPGVTSLLKKIQKGDIPINEYIFNTVVYGYCQANDISGAHGVISLMENKSLNPSSDTYTYLLCAHARNGNIEEMKKILSKCEELEITIEDTQFLEVVYNLVVNGHEEHLDFIFDKIDKTYMFVPAALKIIYRIFFKKKDEAAFLVYNAVFKDEQHQTEFFKDFFLNFAYNNKTPEEIFNSCQLLVPPERFNSAISGVMKKMLFDANLKKFQTFSKLAQKSGFPIRPHYFWPLIISASKNGNNEVLKVLKVMNELNVRPCFDTIKVILQHFHFENSVNHDIALLGQHKLLKRGILKLLLHKFIEEKKYEKALNLSLSKRFDTVGFGLVSCLNAQNAKYIANIYYNLLHDDYLNFDASSKEDSTAKALLKNCFRKLNIFVQTVVERNSENNALEFLKELSNYPVKISEQTISLIKEKFHGNSEIEKICEGLSPTTEEDTIKLDEDLLKRKKSLVFFDASSEFHKAVKNEDFPAAEKYYQNLKDSVSKEDVLTLMTLCVKQKNVEKALELTEDLKTADKRITPKVAFKNCLISFFRELFSFQSEEESSKVLKVFKELGLRYEVTYCLTYIKYLIERGELDKAVDFYCENLNKINVRGHSLVVDNLIDAKQTQLLDKVIDGLANEIGRDPSLRMVFFRYIVKGYSKEAKKFLDIHNIIIGKRHLFEYCQKLLKEGNETGLLSLLEFADDFNISSVLWTLLRLYVQENEPKKIKNLNLIIQDKNFITSQGFHNTLNRYLNQIDQNLPLEPLAPFEEIKNKYRNKMKSQKKKLGSKTETSDTDLNWADLLETENLEKILANTNGKKLAFACSQLLDNNKSETYITVLEKASEINPKLLNFLILARKFNNNLEILSESQLKKIMELATCSLENRLWIPLKRMLILCLRKPQLLETLNEEIDKVFSRRLNEKIILQTSEANNFIENKTLSQKIRSIGYSVFIFTNINVHLETSIEYLESAVNEGIGHSLNKNVLKYLKNEMKERGLDFPYPDLLD